MTDARSWARHAFAEMRGVGRLDDAACRCACCGPSPFRAATRPRAELLSDSFSDLDLLLDPYAPELCAGCESLLQGRPGSDPPPFRTLHAVAGDGWGRVLPLTDDVARVLIEPPAEPFALSWSIARKKHAWLRAERSTADRIVVGTDNGPVTYVPATHRPLLLAVSELLAWFRRDHIESGAYPTPAMTTAGIAWTRDREDVVRPHRPSALLSMLVTLLPRPERPTDNPMELPVMDANDEDAVTLLLAVAMGSGVRVKDGIAFWSHILRRRVRRFQRLPLRDFVARMMAELRIDPHRPQGLALASMAETWDGPRREACSVAIRERGELLIAIAYGRKG